MALVFGPLSGNVFDKGILSAAVQYHNWLNNIQVIAHIAHVPSADFWLSVGPRNGDWDMISVISISQTSGSYSTITDIQLFEAGTVLYNTQETAFEEVTGEGIDITTYANRKTYNLISGFSGKELKIKINCILAEHILIIRHRANLETVANEKTFATVSGISSFFSDGQIAKSYGIGQNATSFACSIFDPTNTYPIGHNSLNPIIVRPGVRDIQNVKLMVSAYKASGVLATTPVAAVFNGPWTDQWGRKGGFTKQVNPSNQFEIDGSTIVYSDSTGYVEITNLATIVNSDGAYIGGNFVEYGDGVGNGLNALRHISFSIGNCPFVTHLYGDDPFSSIDILMMQQGFSGKLVELYPGVIPYLGNPVATTRVINIMPPETIDQLTDPRFATRLKLLNDIYMNYRLYEI